MRWLLDFDDTLAVGPTTWTLQEVIPQMIRAHALPYDASVFDTALLRAQQQANEGASQMQVIDDLFDALGWPSSLKAELADAAFHRYVPSLFEDVLPFLERVQPALVVSNNNYAPQIAATLGITPFLSGIFTPKGCGGVRPKPQRDMWDYLLAQAVVGDGEQAAIVGDDPWSDGAFAQRCGIDCWIIDRLDRYSSLDLPFPIKRVRSLTEVS